MIDKKVIRKVMKAYHSNGTRMASTAINQIYEIVNKRELLVDKLMMKELSPVWNNHGIMLWNIEHSLGVKISLSEMKESLARLERRHTKVSQRIYKGTRYWRKLA